MMLIRDAIAWGRTSLTGAGVEAPRLDAQLLLAHCLGRTRESLLADALARVPEVPLRAYEALIARRAAREPLAHIVGVREFRSLPFAVNGATLVPRPDSETLVEAALDLLGDRMRPWRILDLGTGSGCLLLSLLHECPHARGVGTDILPDAIETARRNARTLGLASRALFRCGDWFGALPESEPPFDLVVSNPPYIPSEDIDALMDEVARFEPRIALDGGEDGLAAYRRILPGLASRLAAGGRAAMEIGEGQGAAVSALLRAEGLVPAGARCDLAGRERVLFARNPLPGAEKHAKTLGI